MNKKLKEGLTLIGEAAVIVALSYSFAFPFRVEGSSMENSYSTGDRVIISRFDVWTGRISRGDAVVCRLDNMQVIKRIIALPGDKIDIREGLVYINGSLLSEPYLAEDTYTGGDMSALMGENEYFVMGDNRGVSLDSRKAGCIGYEDIKGRVFFKLKLGLGG